MQHAFVKYYAENGNPAIVDRETFRPAKNLLRSQKTEKYKRRAYSLTRKLRYPKHIRCIAEGKKLL